MLKERKKKKRKEGKEEGKQRGGSVVHSCTIFPPFFLEQSLVESNDRLSIKDLGLGLRIG